nr:MAG: UTP--glucose-1-phosphate uridylyltransferase [Actinomycetota bacterium]
MAAVRKAVVPAAGLGTRFLPATKAIPKELFPLDYRPVLEHVVAEGAVAGLADVCLITSPGKDALLAHFTPDEGLVSHLMAKGDLARADAVAGIGLGARVTTRVQDVPHGLGHAVSLAEDFADGEPFAVLLGDDLLDERTPALAAMCAAREALGGSVLLLVEVPEDQVSRYGIAAVEGVESPQGLEDWEVVRVTGLQEKPSREQAASRLAIIGRYVLDPAVFDELRTVTPGAGGEIQLTDALAGLAERAPDSGGGVHALVFRGLRYDAGDRLEYVKAVVRFALREPGVADGLRPFLEQILAEESP